MEDGFIKQFGTGVLSNLIFVVAYLGGLLMKKKCKRSHCKMCCIEFDAEIQNTVRSRTKPDVGKGGELV